MKDKNARCPGFDSMSEEDNQSQEEDDDAEYGEVDDELMEGMFNAEGYEQADEFIS